MKFKKIRYLYAAFMELIEVIQAMIQLKIFWLIPAAVFLLIIAVLVALIGGTGPLAPFVYPLL